MNLRRRAGKVIKDPVNKIELTDKRGKYPVFGPLQIDNYERFLSTSKKEFQDNWEKTFTYKESLDDFQKFELLGKGGFGKVYKVKNKNTDEIHAMKLMVKKKLVQSRFLERAKMEKLILQSINSPQAMILDFYFEDEDCLYFIIPYISQGSLFDHLYKMKFFEEYISRFFVAQIILALEYLHYVDIIYRDLKPENILVDHLGNLKLCDFGLCKVMKKGRTYTFCGTHEYLAPEVILSTGYGISIDWWALGVMAFELNCGYTPFISKDELSIMNNIVKGKYRMPLHFSVDLQDLIKHLIQVKATSRLGNWTNGANDIKRHKWFKVINWLALLSRKVSSPYLIIETQDKKDSLEEKNNSLPKLSKTSELYENAFKKINLINEADSNYKKEESKTNDNQKFSITMDSLKTGNNNSSIKHSVMN